MISRRFFFHTSMVLMYLLVTVWASAETVVFRDSTGKTELVDTQNPGEHAMPAGPLEMYGKAGGIAFNVSYEDVTLHNGIGFDDATNGAARRARVGEIFTYLNSVLNHTGVCDVKFTVSDNAGGGGSGVLATGGTYYMQTAGFVNGFAFDHITTGVDPYGSMPDIHVVVHFGWPWYQGTGTPSSSQIDLKSVLLHEVTHGLGICSLTNANGTSAIFSGAYAKWDDLLETGNGKDLFGGNPPAFLGFASDLTGGDNGVRFKGANAMSVYGSKPPIYAPSPWQGGSSIAHWNSGTTGNPVMEPSIGNGEVVRAYPPFEIGAMKDIGYSVVSAAVFGFAQTPTGGWFEEGAKIDLSVSVRNAVGTVTYQWKKDSAVIDGATLSTYTINPAVLDEIGSYYSCQATDTSKAVTTVETTPVLVRVFAFGTLPVAGTIGLVVAALFSMGVGVVGIRRRRMRRL